MQDHASVIQGKHIMRLLVYDSVKHLQSLMDMAGVKELLPMGESWHLGMETDACGYSSQRHIRS